MLLADDGSGGTRLTQGETFSGVLVTLMRGSVGGAETGFEAFSRALAERVAVLDSMS